MHCAGAHTHKAAPIVHPLALTTAARRKGPANIRTIPWLGKGKGPREVFLGPFALEVEAAGIEPASRDISVQTST